MSIDTAIIQLENTISGDSPLWDSIQSVLLPTREILRLNLMRDAGYNEAQAQTLADTIPENSIMVQDIQAMVNSVKTSVNQLYEYSQKVVTDIAKFQADALQVVLAEANALATVPPQPAMAAYILKQYNDSVNAIKQSYSTFIPYLNGLTFLERVIPEGTGIENTVESVLNVFNSNLQILNALPTV